MKLITYDNIKEAIRKVLLPSHNLAIVHSSIGMFGVMDNLVDNCIDAWLEMADESGYTIAMPTFTWSYCKSRIYHYQNTPAETGILPENFRKRKGVIRSEHPIFSLTAYGSLAEKFMLHKGETCWGIDTPFDYLNKNDGLLIMFGVGWEYLTFYHYIEEIKRVPYQYFKTFRGKADYGRGLIDVAPRYYVRSLRLPTEYDFSLIHNTLEKEGKITIEGLGYGFVKALRAKDIYDLGCKLVDEDPYIFLKYKERYLKEAKKPFFVFLGSSNLDIMNSEFEKSYEEMLKDRCRILKMPFGQYKQEILCPDSDIRLEKPNYIVFSERCEELFGETLEFSKDDDSAFQEFKNRLTNYTEFIKYSRELLPGIFLIMNFFPLSSANTNHYLKIKKMIDYANDFLYKEVKSIRDAYVLLYDRAVAKIGILGVAPGKYWFIGRIPYSPKFTKLLCEYILGAYLFLEGKTVRLIITDMDNTLWGGIIGEDGISGIQLGPDYPGNCYISYQKMLKEWQKQGKVLAIASRNTEEVATEAIEKHPEMVLNKKDFISLKINWGNKVDSIKAICEEMNLGLSSACFIDDSPHERQQIRERLPQVFVPEMPEDIADWTGFLSRLPQFEILSLTEEDLRRSGRYRQKAEMEQTRKQFASVADFYRNLEMKLHFKAFSPVNENRVLQLLAKTNQFNTTTRRYKKNDLEGLLKGGGIIVPIGVEDRFSPFELIGLVILCFPKGCPDEAVIDVFLLSCRVLGRNIEQGILSWATRVANETGAKKVKAQVIPTERNIPARDVYARYGFVTLEDNQFEYELGNGTIPMPDYFEVYDEIANISANYQGNIIQKPK